MSEFDVNKQKVLIVEDNVHFRTLVRTILQALGIDKTEEARDGSEAIEVLKTFDADLAIIDWKMDGVDGVECVRRIRAGEDSPNKFLPVLMVTGFTEETLVNEARNAGVNDFLSKPISAKSLLSRIVSVLKNDNPFISTGDYFGPDRRHRDGPFQGADRRGEQTNQVSPS
ncbi:MAG: response regulator [Rhodospirillales bacterium]